MEFLKTRSFTSLYRRVQFAGLALIASATLAFSQNAPTFDPPGGAYITARSVTLSTTTSGGSIYYTLDGSDPQTSLTAVYVANGGTVAVNESARLSARTRSSTTPYTWSGLAAEEYQIVGQISSYGLHVAALPTNGAQVWTWGYGGNGRLGDNNMVNRSSAVNVETSSGSPLTGILHLAAGGAHNLALKADRTLVSWGSNFFGELGTGNTIARSYAGPVINLTNIGYVAVGQNFSFAITNNATAALYSWGVNDNGECGHGNTTSPRATPARVRLTNTPTYLNGVAQVAGGIDHAVALKTNGSVYTWGRNQYGQLGLGTTTQHTLAKATGLTSGVKFIAANESTSGAVKIDGTVWMWGSNTGGQLGNGSTSTGANPTPAQARTPDGLPLTNIVSISIGEEHVLALDENGNVWAWGGNRFGCIGDGTDTPRYNAVQVLASAGTPLERVVAVAAGRHVSYALQDDGTILSWGYNEYGQLGNGTQSLLFPQYFYAVTNPLLPNVTD